MRLRHAPPSMHAPCSLRDIMSICIMLVRDPQRARRVLVAILYYKATLATVMSNVVLISSLQTHQRRMRRQVIVQLTSLVTPDW